MNKMEKKIISALKDPSLDPKILKELQAEMKRQKRPDKMVVCRGLAIAAISIVLAVVVCLPFVFKDRTATRSMEYTMALEQVILMAQRPENAVESDFAPWVGYPYRYAIIQDSFAEIVDSVQSLHDLDAKHGGMIFDERSLYYNEDLSCKMSGYDDDFFTENGILFMAIRLDGYEKKSVKSVEISDNDLVVTLESTPIDGDVDVSDLMTTFIFVIELNEKVEGKVIIRG